MTKNEGYDIIMEYFNNTVSKFTDSQITYMYDGRNLYDQFTEREMGEMDAIKEIVINLIYPIMKKVDKTDK